MPLAELRERVQALSKTLPGGDGEAVLNNLLARWGDVFPSAPSDPTDVAEKVALAPTPPVKHTTIPFDFLKAFMVDTFVAAGVPQDEAVIAAEVLIYADKRGIDSHGIGRLYPIYIKRLQQGIMFPTAEFKILKETESTALVDGGLGLGLYIGHRCMTMCIEKAKKTGVAVVVVRNSTHYGAAGYRKIIALCSEEPYFCVVDRKLT
jgi:Malate/L-lactate dehydrogenase